MILIALFSSVLPLFSAYSLCSPSDVKGPISIPITNVLVTSPIVAAGTIQILDGCTFEVGGFSLSNAGTSKWFGGMGSSADGITLTDDDINPNPAGGKQTFKFRSVAGAAVSFRDFNQFRLFDTQSNTLIAVANVPSNIMSSLSPSDGPTGTVAVGTVAAGAPARTTTSSRTTTTSARPSANGDSLIFSFNGVFAALVMVLGF